MLAFTWAGNRRPARLFNGLGAANYACTAIACHGTTSAMDTLLRRLQGAANTASRYVGLGAPITVDGAIGPATIAKLYDISGAMPTRTDLPLLMGFLKQTAPATVVANASNFVDELEGLVSGEIQMPPEQVPPGTEPPPPGAGPQMTTIDPYPGTAPASYAMPGISSVPKAAKVVMGVSAIGIATWLILRAHKKHAGISGHRRRRR